MYVSSNHQTKPKQEQNIKQFSIPLIKAVLALKEGQILLGEGGHDHPVDRAKTCSVIQWNHLIHFSKVFSKINRITANEVLVIEHVVHL